MLKNCLDKKKSDVIIVNINIRVLSVLQTRGRKRIDNPVRIRNGTATVNAEAVYTGESRSLEKSEKTCTQADDA